MRTASSWPTTRLPSASSMRSSLSLSPSSILRDRDAGPLGDDLGDLLFGDACCAPAACVLLSAACAAASCFSSSGIVPYCSSAIARGRWRGARSPARACTLLELLLDVRGALQRGLLGLPDLLEVGVFASPARSSVVLERRRGASSRPRRLPSSAPPARSCSWMMRRSSLSISSGLESISMRMRAPASSIRSMALSGSWRSAM